MSPRAALLVLGLAVQALAQTAFQLPGGLRVQVRQRPAPAVMEGALAIPGPKGLAAPEGVADLALRTLREGGSTLQGTQDLNELLERAGAEIQAVTAPEGALLAFTCPETSAELVLGLVANLLRLPAYPPRTLEGVRAARMEQLQPRPGTRLQRLDAALEAPAVTARLEVLRRLQVSDLGAWHRAAVVPEGACLVLSTTLPTERVRELVEGALGAWREASTSLPPVAAAPPTPFTGTAVAAGLAARDASLVERAAAHFVAEALAGRDLAPRPGTTPGGRPRLAWVLDTGAPARDLAAALRPRLETLRAARPAPAQLQAAWDRARLDLRLEARSEPGRSRRDARAALRAPDPEAFPAEAVARAVKALLDPARLVLVGE